MYVALLTIHTIFISLSGINIEMKTGGDWVLANINVTGYYRVNYDLGNWERLLTQLNKDHQVHTVVSFPKHMKNYLRSS